ncbi:hypothetical protein ACOSP7_002884 [Xanthoceras sorbifolium]
MQMVPSFVCFVIQSGGSSKPGSVISLPRVFIPLSLLVFPPISYIPYLPENFLEATSKDALEERAPFNAGIDKNESDEERLVRCNTGKDKDPAFKEPGVPLDSRSKVETNLSVPLTDIAESSRMNGGPDLDFDYLLSDGEEDISLSNKEELSEMETDSEDQLSLLELSRKRKASQDPGPSAS